MKKFIAAFSAVCLTFSAIAFAAAESQTEKVRVEEFTVTLQEGQTSRSTDDGGVSFVLTEDHSAVSVILLDTSSFAYGIKKNVPKVQQDLMSDAVKERAKVEPQEVERTVLGETVVFDEFEQKDGTYWSVGTFPGDDFVCTLLYVSDIWSEEENEKYDDFLAGIERYNPFTDAVKTIKLVAGEKGQYGEPFTINKGTEFEENYFVYRVPAGTYLVTNVGKYMGQFDVMGDTVYITDAGWEELSDVYYVKALKAGESDTVTIEDGQIIEIHEPSQFELTRVD